MDRLDAPSAADQRYRLLVESITDYAIYMLDTSGCIASWNPGANRMTGYEEAEVVGSHYSVFHTNDDRLKGLPRRGLEIAEREGAFRTEGWRLRKNGSRFWASVVIDPVRDAAGRLVGFAKITRDMTEVRNTQQDLERAREALFQSRKLEAVGQLTGSIAHDFNNLLMVVLGGLEIMRKRIPEDPNTLSLLNNAIEAAQQGKALVQRMLSLARRQALKPETIDASAVVHGMMDFLHRNLGPLIFLDARFPPVLGAVHADPNQLELVLLNLAMNARDALPNGGLIAISGREATINAGLEDKPDHRRFICLTVAARGGGMAEIILSKKAGSDAADGSAGLGVSMACGFAEQSGGKFVHRRVPGQGTVAELWLPVVAAYAEVPADRQQAIVGDESPRRPTGSRSHVVLAVHDDRLALMNTTSMLNSLGHKVFAATCGQQALDLLRHETSIDLVLIDPAMAENMRLALAKTIRAEWPARSVIFAAPAAASLSSKLSKSMQQDHLANAINRFSKLRIVGAPV